MEGQVATFEPEVTQMDRRNHRVLWMVGALFALGAVMLSLVVFADRGDVQLTATMYSDVIRFEADGVASLRLTIYDLAENELWSSGLIPGDLVDWDRMSAAGERLANGYYLYLAQGWDASDSLILNRAGKVVLLPGDQVQLQTAPASPGGSSAAIIRDGPVYGLQAYDAADWYVSNSLGVGTDNPQDPVDVHGYIRCYYLREESITPQMRWYETDAADDPNDYIRHEYGGNKYRMQWRDDSAGTWFNALIADGSARCVGINTTSPGKTLDVNGTGRFTGALTIGAYTLPTADGTNGQVLATDGTGTVSWTTIAGGGSGYWEESGGNISNTNSGQVEVDTGTFRVSDPSGLVELFLQSGANTWSWNATTGGACHLYDDTNGRFVLWADEYGDVGIGTSTPEAKLHVDGTLFAEGKVGIGMKNDWAAPGLIVVDQIILKDGAWTFGAGYSGIVSSSGELWAIDQNANMTKLSPHDEETGEWIFYSKNMETGRVVRVDMERLVRVVEELTGETFLIESWEAVPVPEMVGGERVYHGTE